MASRGKGVDAQGRSVIVCDNGTGFVKCGFAGSNFPAHIFPCMVGKMLMRSGVKSIEGVEIKVQKQNKTPCVGCIISANYLF